MANDVKAKHVGVIGDGCAALSLAARAAELPEYDIVVYRPSNAPAAKDHIWGFWSSAMVKRAETLALAKWHHWKVITHQGESTLTSTDRPYNAMRRSAWEKSCREAAEAAGVRFLEGSDTTQHTGIQWLDTRPPSIPEGLMLQHFVGHEIRTGEPAFDPSTAILMDFRVDQSRGMHFMYVLPFSDTHALVESTLFSPQLEDDSFYTEAITNYLSEHIGTSDYSVEHREKGMIPLGELEPHDAGLSGLGGNGGAIRPSSGYAFPFIQQQIDRAIKGPTSDELIVRSPHEAIDLWMDAVMLSVLRNEPERAPTVFLRMGQALTGDEFARFLNGEATWQLRLKIIFAMPKWPFIKAALRLWLATGKVTFKGGRAWTS